MTHIDYARYSMNVALYVRETCRRKKIPQKTWPDEFGFTKQAVMAWKKGESNPTFENLLIIAAVLDEKDLSVIVGWGARLAPK